MPESTKARAAAALPLPDEDVMHYLVRTKLLLKVLGHLKPCIKDVFNFTRTCKFTWAHLSCDYELWRQLYLENDPLMTPDIRKRLAKEKYTAQTAMYTFKRCGLQQSVWVRTCTFLFTKPRLILVLAGKDPIVSRRLGSPESEAECVTLGLNYHLDSFMDEDEKRFEFEFPQVFQDLNFGDIVVTQDFKGAGCWTALPSLDGSPFVRLKKNGHDSAGFGILHKDVAPPTFPLFYYFDAKFDTSAHPDKESLHINKVYWFSYTQLKDKSMFSWNDHVVFDEL